MLHVLFFVVSLLYVELDQIFGMIPFQMYYRFHDE